jgi:hypothetical protein
MFTNLQTIVGRRSNKVVHEVHLGWNVQKMVMETLMLEKSEGAVALVDWGLEGFPQTKFGLG